MDLIQNSGIVYDKQLFNFKKEYSHSHAFQKIIFIIQEF